MAVFQPITRISGTLNITVAPRHGTSAAFSKLQGTTISVGFTGAARKDGVTDVGGTLGVGLAFAGGASISRVGQGDADFLLLNSVGANYAYSAGRVSFEPWTTFGEDGAPAGAYAIGSASLSLFSSFGIGLTGGIGQGDVTFRPLGSIGSDYAYSAGIVSFLPLTARGIGELLTPDFIVSTATARIRYHVTAPTSLLEITSEAVAKRRLYLTAASAGTLSTVAVARAVHHLLAASRGIVYSAARHYAVVSLRPPAPGETWLRAGVVEGVARYRVEQGETWLFNATTYAASRVQGYFFDTLARLGPSVYGAGPDGIFEITGDTDAGAEIEASFFTGREGYGTPSVKRIAVGYITGTSDDKLDVRVIDDTGQGYDYETERALGDTVRSVRFKTGKGLKGHLWQFGVRNQDGGAFELTRGLDLPKRRFDRNLPSARGADEDLIRSFRDGGARLRPERGAVV